MSDSGDVCEAREDDGKHCLHEYEFGKTSACGWCGDVFLHDPCEEPEHGTEMPAEPQPCGHPAACVVSSDDGTNQCGWCADKRQLYAAYVYAEDQGYDGGQRGPPHDETEPRLPAWEEDGGETENLCRDC